ncbi:hypothetical protein JXA32_04330 [Candidatus Sumerlaeota bacterium]|nr:hypothetical protein [Candidatus Sumerlaeota bacterium]
MCIDSPDLPPQNNRPHLVLLGAGASYAAFPNGDRNGRKLPLMMNFIETIGMEELANRTGLNWEGRNFENFYSDLYEDNSKCDIRHEIENFIFDYFFNLQIPDEPTIYDYLILSLRDKDAIATFNWDTFLIYAAWRNANVVGPEHMPAIFFLHGNTAIRYKFEENGVLQKTLANPANDRCLKNAGWESPPLLYPVKQKDYQNNPMIRKEWEGIIRYMEDAYLFTIFGYGAPSTDVEAMKLLKEGWGDVHQRNLEQVEIIDIKDERELEATWSEFIHSGHYHILNSYFDSTMAQMPRRSSEAFFAATMEMEPARPCPAPQNLSLAELQEWFRPLIEKEQGA